MGIVSNDFNFIYDGNIINDTELSIEQILNEKEKNSYEMNVLVKEKEKANNKENKNYESKINYKFRKNPNFKYKLDITKSNDPFGCNDIFEVFISYKDNKEYIISFNYKTFNLEQYELLSNKKIRTLKAHDNKITTVRYFINNNNYNEYLVSADSKAIVIIWDITNDFNIKNKIKLVIHHYNNYINSSLLLFTHYEDKKNFFILKSLEHYINIYSFDDAKFFYRITNINTKIYYFLSWYNKKNNKYYIISLGEKRIILNDLDRIEQKVEFVKYPEDSHLYGFIYNKDNNDYLSCSSTNG